MSTAPSLKAEPAQPTPAAVPASPRPSVIQLAIKEKAALYAAYIPYFSEGGIFIPSTKDYKLGDDIYLLLSLPNEPQRYPIAGKVAWVTPPHASNNRTQGVGVHFPADEKSRNWKKEYNLRVSNPCSCGPI